MREMMNPATCKSLACMSMKWIGTDQAVHEARESKTDEPYCKTRGARIAEVEACVCPVVGGYDDSMLPVKPGETGLSADSVGKMVQAMIAPVFEQFGTILERTNQAIERIAAANTMMNARITELEKQVRLQKPVSKSQEKYINDAIRKRAKELLDGKGFAEDRKAIAKLSAAIRKSVLARYGVSSLREAPAYDYETALEQAARWNDLVVLKEITKEARTRESGTPAVARSQEKRRAAGALKEG